MGQEQPNNQKDREKPAGETNHVGGVSNELGGVDPEIDTTLMRLSGGP